MVREEIDVYFKEIIEGEKTVENNKAEIAELKEKIKEIDNQIAGLENRIKIKAIEKEKKTHTQEINNLEEKVKSLGLFKGKEKSALKAKMVPHFDAITECENKIAELRNEKADQIEPLENELLQLNDKKDQLTSANEKFYADNANKIALLKSVEEEYKVQKEKFDFKEFLESYEKLNKLKFRMSKNGTFLEFGKYPQTTETEFEPIDWKVVVKNGNEVLLLSRYILDTKAFNETPSNNWDNSSLKKWLNTEFKETAFTSLERTIIKNDEITLLTVEEVDKHFKKDKMFKANATAYARIKRLYVDAANYSHWWLKNPGMSNEFGSFVRAAGIVNAYGTDVTDATIGVRPAIWIKVKK